MWHILTLNDSYRKFTRSKECTCSGRLAIPLRSHHGSKRLLISVSSFWASGGHRSGSASGSWTRLCYFTGIVTCDPQAQWCAEVCSGPLQEEAAFPIRWLRVNLGRCSWRSLRCCMFASWILLNAGCFFVKECRRSRLFFASFYEASCDPCHLQLACHGSGTIGLFSWTGLCEAELAPTSSASLGLFELHSEATSWTDLGYFKLGEIYSYHQQMIRVQNEIPRRGPYLPGRNIWY